MKQLILCTICFSLLALTGCNQDVIRTKASEQARLPYQYRLVAYSHSMSPILQYGDWIQVNAYPYEKLEELRAKEKRVMVIRLSPYAIHFLGPRIMGHGKDAVYITSGYNNRYDDEIYLTYETYIGIGHKLNLPKP